MNKLYALPIIGLTMISGCASTGGPHRVSDAWITPPQAVLLAANAAPRGVEGTFRLKVRAVGTDGARTFLNSELDYRDQRNLSVALMPEATAQLRARLPDGLDVSLKGRTIVVTGAAIRTKIVFTSDGGPTDKYYYQTHVIVRNADQIVVE